MHANKNTHVNTPLYYQRGSSCGKCSDRSKCIDEACKNRSTPARLRCGAAIIAMGLMVVAVALLFLSKFITGVW